MYKPSDDVRKAGEQVYIWGSGAVLAHIFSLNFTKLPSPLDALNLPKISLDAAGVLALPTLFFLVRLILYAVQEIASDGATGAYEDYEKFRSLPNNIRTNRDDPSVKPILDGLLRRALVYSETIRIAALIRIFVEIIVPVIFGFVVIWACSKSLAVVIWQLLGP